MDYRIVGGDQQEYGPISAETVRQWLQEGRLDRNSRMKAEGSPIWKRVCDFPEFADVAPPAPEVGAPPGVGTAFAVPGGREAAVARVQGAATGLTVTGILCLVAVALGLASTVLRAAGVIPTGFGNVPPEMRGFMEMMNKFGLVGGIIQAAIGAAIGLMVLMAGGKLKRLENHGFVLAASILAMIPCISPCCIVGLPIGIWVLVTINKPEVKPFFS